mmetsp:Transcript_37885/g.119599  ORF Transcript_37885/g.119599 Transcript_37885/m.119599 type:complete len:227 (+) Transcript_37885:123-803(+)
MAGWTGSFSGRSATGSQGKPSGRPCSSRQHPARPPSCARSKRLSSTSTRRSSEPRSSACTSASSTGTFPFCAKSRAFSNLPSPSSTTLPPTSRRRPLRRGHALWSRGGIQATSTSSSKGKRACSGTCHSEKDAKRSRIERSGGFGKIRRPRSSRTSSAGGLGRGGGPYGSFGPTCAVLSAATAAGTCRWRATHSSRRRCRWRVLRPRCWSFPRSTSSTSSATNACT